MGSNYCDEVIYYLSFEIVTVVWVVSFLIMMWFVANVCYDERFRKSVVDVIRYEIIYSDQLSYELNRARHLRISRVARRIKRTAVKAAVSKANDVENNVKGTVSQEKCVKPGFAMQNGFKK